jgi:hypothetical protein
MASAASLSLFPYEHTLRYRKIFMANIRGKVYERDMKEADWERGATFFTGNLTIVSKPILLLWREFGWPIFEDVFETLTTQQHKL